MSHTIDFVLIDLTTSLSTTVYRKRFFNPRLTLAITKEFPFIIENIFVLHRRDDAMLYASAGVVSDIRWSSDPGVIFGLGSVYRFSRNAHFCLEYHLPLNEHILDEQFKGAVVRFGLGYSF